MVVVAVVVTEISTFWKMQYNHEDIKKWHVCVLTLIKTRVSHVTSLVSYVSGLSSAWDLRTERSKEGHSPQLVFGREVE